jgi:sortase (surface protein transpeptidase)
MPASRPVSIAIPAIHVNASLLRLGRAADNTLEVPPPGRHYDDAGWYRYSPTPGELGPSVIVGHVDSAKNGPSVFWRLATLKKKDRVKVTRTDGSVAVFEVDDVRLFRKKAFPTQLVYGNTDHAALRLITCGGPFDSAGHYRDNVVVLASLVAG